MVFHDLTEGRICPPDCKTLFGLGSKFVIQPEWTTSNSDINLSFDRFDRNIQVKSFFADMGEDDDMGSSKLYVKSKWIPPAGSFSKEFYRRLKTFRETIVPLFNSRKVNTNLSPPQRCLLLNFKQEQNIITVNTDKGLGIARIEYERYVRDAFTHHSTTRRPTNKSRVQKRPPKPTRSETGSMNG